MITYETIIKVKLDGKVTGTIKSVSSHHIDDGWQYFPKGSKTGGDVFASLNLCKHSLGNYD